jgi:hypothetical protein
MFLGSVKDRFSVPAMIVEGAGRGGGQGRRAAPPRSGLALRAAPLGARMVMAGALRKLSFCQYRKCTFARRAAQSAHKAELSLKHTI